MDTITLTYDGQDVALAGRERFWLAAHIEALPDGHPTKRLVAFMALFARDVLTGDLPACRRVTEGVCDRLMHQRRTATAPPSPWGSTTIGQSGLTTSGGRS